MRRQGTHTYDIFLEYLQCPSCGYIIENRDDYQYRLGRRQKDLKCDRCSHRFVSTDTSKPTFGPFFN